MGDGWSAGSGFAQRPSLPLFGRSRAAAARAFRGAAFRRSFSGIELALRDDSQALAAELETLLGALTEGGDALGERIDAAMRRLDALLGHDAWPTLPFAAELQQVADTLEACRAAVAERHAVLWPRLAAQLAEAYEGLAAALSADEAVVRADRPANYARTAFHVFSAVVCLVLTLVVFTPTQLPWAAAAFAGTAWMLEILRRISPAANDRLMAFFRPIAHAAESTRVNSATWYMTSLVVLASTGSTILAVVGVAVLGFADPVAGLVGRRFGKRQLLHGRTLEGSVAFFVAGTLAAFSLCWLVPGHPSAGVMLLTAATAALAGAAAELFSRRVDDNLSIPLSAAAAAALVLTVVGVSPW